MYLHWTFNQLSYIADSGTSKLFMIKMINSVLDQELMYQIMNPSLFTFKPSFHTETYYRSYGCTVIILNSIIVKWCCSIECFSGCIYLTKNLHKRTQITADY